MHYKNIENLARLALRLYLNYITVVYFRNIRAKIDYKGILKPKIKENNKPYTHEKREITGHYRSICVKQT